MAVLKGEEEEEEEQSMSSSATESRTRADEAKEAIQCPRCHSFSTKFCYFNNYNTTQPRHFCKNCKRYWTHGGALRNVPVGGGSKKNKRPKVGCADQKSNSSPKSATSALMNEEEEEGGRGRGKEAGTQRMTFTEEHHVKRCRTEQHRFIPSLPFQLHGFPYFDSTMLAFTSSASPTSFDHINDGLSQTNTQSNSDIGPGSLIDSIVPSDVGPSLVDCIYPDSECNKYCYDQPLIQQTQQQVKIHSPTPPDQTLTDEKGQKHVIAGASDEIFDQMRDNFSIQGSETFLYDVKNVTSEWQIGLEDHFDPTNDLCYMGGPEIWSDFSPFDGGSGTVI